MSRLLATVAAVAVIVSSFAINTNIALGHERRTVGPYTFVVGWLNEPAYVNLLNSLDLTVTETIGAKAVEGLDKTLKADLTFGGSTTPQPLTIAARFGLPGKYSGYVVPTKVGDYTFHITGTVGTMNIDEKFESGPGRFGSIESTDALQYPAKVVSNTDLAGRLDQLQTLVIAGIVLGGFALLVSAAGLVVRRR
ncbi:MAG TPA: hypothetical protein VNB51_07525 [Candidatus Udaeobacter sp.]|jgi:hypothetical protein|nr:hypothetical protein [Candidatus Udaeobacter sp.]